MSQRLEAVVRKLQAPKPEGAESRWKVREHVAVNVKRLQSGSTLPEKNTIEKTRASAS